jgi:hypothetical protein
MHTQNKFPTRHTHREKERGGGTDYIRGKKNNQETPPLFFSMKKTSQFSSSFLKKKVSSAGFTVVIFPTVFSSYSNTPTYCL